DQRRGERVERTALAHQRARQRHAQAVREQLRHLDGHQRVDAEAGEVGVAGDGLVGGQAEGGAQLVAGQRGDALVAGGRGDGAQLGGQGRGCALAGGSVHERGEPARQARGGTGELWPADLGDGDVGGGAAAQDGGEGGAPFVGGEGGERPAVAGSAAAGGH